MEIRGYTPENEEYKIHSIEGGGDPEMLIKQHMSLAENWKDKYPDVSFIYPNPQNENLVYAYRKTTDGRANYPEYELRWENGEYVKKPSSADLEKAA